MIFGLLVAALLAGIMITLLVLFFREFKEVEQIDRELDQIEQGIERWRREK